MSVGLVKGLATTARVLLRPSHTAEYPDVAPTLPPRSRGVIALVEENCTVCMLCSRECPDWCIYIDSHKETIPATTPGGRERQRNVLDRFAIDFSLCMYCGICIEACPFDALYWSPEFEYSEFDVRDLLHEKERLGAWVASVPPPPLADPRAPEPKEVASARAAAEKALRAAADPSGVAAGAPAARRERPERGERPARAERPDRGERPVRAERPVARADRPERPARTAGPEAAVPAGGEPAATAAMEQVAPARPAEPAAAPPEQVTAQSEQSDAQSEQAKGTSAEPAVAASVVAEPPTEQFQVAPPTEQFQVAPPTEQFQVAPPTEQFQVAPPTQVFPEPEPEPGPAAEPRSSAAVSGDTGTPAPTSAEEPAPVVEEPVAVAEEPAPVADVDARPETQLIDTAPSTRAIVVDETVALPVIPDHAPPAERASVEPAPAEPAPADEPPADSPTEAPAEPAPEPEPRSVPVKKAAPRARKTTQPKTTQPRARTTGAGPDDQPPAKKSASTSRRRKTIPPIDGPASPAQPEPPSAPQNPSTGEDEAGR